ncbi:MAG: hypothetical protein LYZ69_07945 [Nitrososphaerales archaeon]|nr:hypothetical protein [Nitrososphaerales archaeon]
MSRICVMTADGRAYYTIVSKLRSAGLPFLSLVPGDRSEECELVLTTRAEAGLFHTPTMALEDLDANSDVASGQILARLSEGDRMLLVGLDPGSRIGMAAFLGETRIASQTFNSKVYACNGVIKLVEGVSVRRSFVRIGDGDPVMAAWLADNLAARLPTTVVEVVDESGTSRNLRVKGLQKDQGSVAKIAFRKGSPFTHDDRTSRSP